MSGSISYKIAPIYGHVTLIQTTGYEDGKLMMGGYAIHYDENGLETSRTENTWYCALSYE